METVSSMQVPFPRASSFPERVDALDCCASSITLDNRQISANYSATTAGKQHIEVRTVQTTHGARSATRKDTLLEMRPVSTIQSLRSRLFLLLGHPMFSPIFTLARLRYLALYTNLRNMPTNTSRPSVVGTYQRHRRSNQRTRLLLQNKSGKGFLPLRVLNLKR